jgi:hypothetical protein
MLSLLKINAVDSERTFLFSLSIYINQLARPLELSAAPGLTLLGSEFKCLLLTVPVPRSPRTVPPTIWGICVCVCGVCLVSAPKTETKYTNLYKNSERDLGCDEDEILCVRSIVCV